jgi:hypothetical protein
MKYHPGMYELRTLRGLRKGAEFFGTAPTAAQLQWAAKSYDTIAFERWSHSRKWMNQLCGNSLVMLFPLSWIVNAKISLNTMELLPIHKTIWHTTVSSNTP